MPVIRLASETDFAGWRAAARELRLDNVHPDEVFWSVDGASPLPLDGGEAGRGGVGSELRGQVQAGSEPNGANLSPTPRTPSSPTLLPSRGKGDLTVPRAFLEMAETVILHRSPERFALLYRLLWRLKDEPRLLEIITDSDVVRAGQLAKAVSQAAYKMKAYARFRLAESVEPETYIAWFEPLHRVTERAAPHFVKRFANMHFSILTPDACAHWDTRELTFTPGVSAAQAPTDDRLEDFWRTYYASVFNPARLKVKAMQAQMPKAYWRNLPEARLIPSLIEQAESRTLAMVQSAPTTPERRLPAGRAARASNAIIEPGETPMPPSLPALAELIQGCRRCDLWRNATQGVAGEGPSDAPLMLVGEQPGDQEDLAGKPFVGPAGKVLDRALAEAGIDRSKVYVTNAVKHFKHQLSGPRRLHRTPDTTEVKACRWWLETERRLVRPRVIVALGATAALSVFGRTLPIGKSRGQAFQLEDQSQAFVTYHPSFLLRVPDKAAKEKAYGEFVQDLGQAWAYLARAA